MQEETLEKLAKFANEFNQERASQADTESLLPQFIYQLPNGGIGMAMIDPMFMRSSEDKEMLRGILQDILKKEGAIRYVMISEAWKARMTGDPTVDRKQPKDREDRDEVVLLKGADKVAEKAIFCCRTIIRDQNGMIAGLKEGEIVDQPYNQSGAIFSNFFIEET